MICLENTIKQKGLNAATRLMIAVGSVFILAAIIAILMVNRQMKHYALTEAKAKARIMLDRNLATHTYFSHQLKPSVFRAFQSAKKEPEFNPSWMSSTYAVREMEKIYASLADAPYYYKECAVNARSPENEADAFERAFVERLNQDPGIVDEAFVRQIGGRTFYTVLRRGESIQETCLRCHTRPELAPRGMVDIYGPTRSFNRSLGEVVSAISIRIPIEAAYAEANRTSVQLALVFVFMLLSLYGIVMSLNNHWILKPLKTIRKKALLISSEPSSHLGEHIDTPKGREMAQLASAFNVMSSQLQRERDLLEQNVLERTDQLQHEIAGHQETIHKLEVTLSEVKQLRGILPICANCKKIRNDSGYWEQIEEYISEHSNADFSHSICPKCSKMLYGDLID
jgi:hypothetical protein